jgi:trehalose/maltose hydrolase-like predicted phosphorylase
MTTIAQSSETWCIRASGDGACARERNRAVHALGNGYLGVLGAREEECFGAEAQRATIYLNGVFETVPIRYHERFPAFAHATDVRPPVASPLPLGVCVDGELLGRDGTLLEQECTLDLRTGVLRRQVRWRTASGRTLDLTLERFVSFARSSLLVSRVTLAPVNFDGDIELISCLDGPPAALGTPHDADDPRLSGEFAQQPWRLLDYRATADALALLHETTRSKHRVAVGVAHRGDANLLSMARAPHETQRLSAVARLSARCGSSVTLEKFAAFCSHGAAHDENLVEMALAESAGAAAEGFAVLVAEQREIVQSFWSGSAITIEGRSDLERAVRFNMFQLFQAAGRDSRTSLAARGQTGRAYEGHYFWDAEVFCLPMFVFCAPAIARSMLAFRHQTLPAARRNARAMGHAQGALFPWRTIGGSECSAFFPAGAAQYHLNAGIAHAVRQYWEATGDVQFLADVGAELVIETARIWLEVGFFNPRRNGQFCIPGVTGPDEYTALVDNNFYTNAMAQAHLEFAVQLVALLQADVPQSWHALAGKLLLHPAEVALWARAARSMYLPYDATLGIFAQDDTFLDKKPWDPGARPHADGPLLLHFHPLVLYRHKLCKQADAVLAMFLLADRFEFAQRRRTFEYYEAVTVHDSTLSPGIFSIVASGIGDLDKAFEYAQRTARVDLDDLHGNTCDGLHMAALGASWMTLSMGFAGLKLVAGTPTFRPALPAQLTRYSFLIRIRDSVLEVAVDAQGATYRLSSGPPLTLRHCAMTVTISADAAPTLPLQSVQDGPVLRRA